MPNLMADFFKSTKDIQTEDNKKETNDEENSR